MIIACSNNRCYNQNNLIIKPKKYVLVDSSLSKVENRCRFRPICRFYYLMIIVTFVPIQWSSILVCSFPSSSSWFVGFDCCTRFGFNHCCCFLETNNNNNIKQLANSSVNPTTTTTTTTTSLFFALTIFNKVDDNDNKKSKTKRRSTTTTTTNKKKKKK